MLAVSSMNAGGAERVAATLANAWAQRGDAVTLLPTYSGAVIAFIRWPPTSNWYGWLRPCPPAARWRRSSDCSVCGA
ncbi:putative glycosyltransferase domain protein [Bordetella holmesii 70147]|nr:putative glycosyltransferase domain protein [Bordetella holmesii 70147]